MMRTATCIMMLILVSPVLYCTVPPPPPTTNRTQYVDAFLEDLSWLGVRWGEGPDVGGPHAPYDQSARGRLYHAAFEALRAAGAVYPCACSRKVWMQVEGIDTVYGASAQFGNAVGAGGCSIQDSGASHVPQLACCPGLRKLRGCGAKGSKEDA